MRTHRALIGATAVLCVALASCSKSRKPSGTDEAPHVAAGTSGTRPATRPGNEGGAGESRAPGVSGGAGASGASGAAGRAGGDAPAAGSAGLQPPAASCAGPWYRCPEVCPRQLILDGATRTFGECLGDCGFELDLWPAIVLDKGDCDSLQATLEVRNTDGTQRTYRGALTEAAFERALTISVDLAGTYAGIPAVSGCPDCADGGAAALLIGAPDQPAQTFTYQFGDPPAPLRAADEFMQELIDALIACDSALFEGGCSQTVEPPPDPDGTPDGPQCQLVYSSATSSVVCTMPADVGRPCAAAARCLCQSQILQGSPGDVDGCVASWLTPRGAITFADVCTQGASDATPAFPGALQMFAAAYGAMVTTGPECDALSAYY